MSPTRVRWMAVAGRFREYVRADAAIYAAVAIYIVLGVFYLAASDRLHPSDIAATFQAYAQLFTVEHIIVFPLLLLALAYVVITLRLDRRRGLAYRIRFGAKPVARLLAGIVLLLVAFLPFRTMFNSVKNVIPDQTGFLYDKALANFDQALHFGREPFEWLYSIFKHPWLLNAIEINYDTVWFAICFGMQYWVATSPLFDRTRVRYMFCYILVWAVAGNLVATLGSSAGPIYYGLVTGDFHRFAEVATFTASGAGGFASTNTFQNYLWYLYSNDLPGLGSGISAFPSMHVAIVVMNAMFLVEARSKWLVPAVLYVLIVLGSSVYLGWHYAVDGYASIAITAAIFFGLRYAMAHNWRFAQLREGEPAAVPD
jgi:hypothetical protein